MEDKSSDKDADSKFQRTLEKLIGTPPKPHKPSASEPPKPPSKPG